MSFIYILIKYYYKTTNGKKQVFWKTCFKKHINKNKNMAGILLLSLLNETHVALAKSPLPMCCMYRSSNMRSERQVRNYNFCICNWFSTRSNYIYMCVLIKLTGFISNLGISHTLGDVSNALCHLRFKCNSSSFSMQRRTQQSTLVVTLRVKDDKNRWKIGAIKAWISTTIWHETWPMKYHMCERQIIQGKFSGLHLLNTNCVNELN